MSFFVGVLGYGCHLTTKMKIYLRRVKDFSCSKSPLSKLIKEEPLVNSIVLTGGFTNQKTAPNISEAEMMKNYLIQELSIKDVPLYKEDQSITTIQNLQAIKRIAEGLNFELKSDNLILFCNEGHKYKILVLSYFIFGFWPKYIFTHPFSFGFKEFIKQTVIALPLEVLSLRFPFFKKLVFKRKAKLIKNS